MATHQVVEGDDLLFQAQLDVVRAEEGRVLFLELLPHDVGERWVDACLRLQRREDFGLRRVLDWQIAA